jgi:hypothetical protein
MAQNAALLFKHLIHDGPEPEESVVAVLASIRINQHQPTHPFQESVAHRSANRSRRTSRTKQSHVPNPLEQQIQIRQRPAAARPDEGRTDRIRFITRKIVCLGIYEKLIDTPMLSS